MLIFTVHMHSKVNSFLCVCIFVYSWQTRVTAMPKVVVRFFFPLTLEQKVHLRNTFFGPATGVDCQNALCNHCNLRGGVVRGRREAGTGVGCRSKPTHSTHIERAKPAESLPARTNQMLPCDSCEEPEQRSTEAVCC